MKKILVTGGSGYIASWIINYLLEQEMTVHTTVRDLKNTEKISHLLEMQKNKPDNLKLFEADLLKENSFKKAMDDCQVVIHTASPFVMKVKNAREELIKPALTGTRTVLNTASQTKTVKRIVLTSSIVAMYGDATDVEKMDNQTILEKYWNQSSNEKHNPYAYSKTLAEQEAWRIAESQNQWEMAVINPGFVMGPSLSKRKDSTSIDLMISLLSGKFKQGVPEMYFAMVDVRDIAQAHIYAAFNTEVKARHIVANKVIPMLEMAQLLNENFSQYPLPSKQVPKFLMYLTAPFLGFTWKYISKNVGKPIKIDNSYSKKNLKINYRTLQETLTEHAQQLIDDGLVKKR